MTKELTDRLPDSLRELLNGEDLGAKEGETFILVTVNDDGWPNLALLSVGEVFVPSLHEIRMALWPGTNTTGNLERSGRATLAAFWGDTAYYVELDVQSFVRSGPTEDSLVRFSGRVRQVLADKVDYADLTSGVRFLLKDKAHVVPRWHQVIQTLRGGSASEGPADGPMGSL